MCLASRLAKVVNFLDIQQIKQVTETARFRIGFTLHSCQYDTSCFNNAFLYTQMSMRPGTQELSVTVSPSTVFIYVLSISSVYKYDSCARGQNIRI